MILEAYDCEDTLLLRVSGEPGSLVFETFEPYLPEMVKRHQTVGLMYWRVEGPDLLSRSWSRLATRTTLTTSRPTCETRVLSASFSGKAPLLGSMCWSQFIFC